MTFIVFWWVLLAQHFNAKLDKIDGSFKFVLFSHFNHQLQNLILKDTLYMHIWFLFD